MSRTCEVCDRSGAHESRLVAPGELRKCYVAQAMADPENRANLCRPCHLALNVLARRARSDHTTAPVLILYREKLDLLIVKRNRIRQNELRSQMFLSFGRVETRSGYKKGLEGMHGV
jgi:hypothetical protein